MAEYDWLDSQAFREAIETQVSRSARLSGMEQYQNAVVTRLYEYLDRHKDFLIEQELKKTSSLRKTRKNAIDSVSTLIERASEIAKKDDRKLLKEDDVKQAYREKFCMVWPFCGRR